MTIPANDVRIPPAVREALARNEPVMVVSHGRPNYVILSPEAHRSIHGIEPAMRGRSLRAALARLASGPRPDPGFADDLEAIRADVGPMPADPWERS